MPEQTKKMADRPLHELLSRDMVDIYVGPENTHWILHEKLLCARSAFFRNIFYDPSNSTKSFGLPDDDDAAFKAFVGWLYSGTVPPPRQESDLGVAFELYLMGERWSIDGLRRDVMQVVQSWYHQSDTYPGLRRVQYVYANTEDGSEMRALLVGSIARMLVLGRDGLPKHWDKALRKNGQLAVDIITMVQKWKLDEDSVPDVRAPEAEGKIPQLPQSNKAQDTVKEVSKTASDTTKQVLDSELPTGLVNGVSGELPNGGAVKDIKNNAGKKLPNGLTNGLPHNLPNGVPKQLPNGIAH